eukprot:TRINITY_DN50380_c0_g1_i1.p1 TRINITY_DN50380_c0_g1~~TRINITY_DN50380_c0_g1_i1.p1  ORF type:complete len:622 (+),score=177.70 TRINITY_DN50380_c0_g1_i1:94-1866(+)
MTRAPGAARQPGSFFQEPPRLGNQYEADPYLQAVLKRIVDPSVLRDIEPDLRRFGHRVATDVMDMSDDASADPPRVRPYDCWGNRVDVIETSKGWRMLHDVAAEEGLVAIAHERRHGALSRVHWAAKCTLFGPSSGLYNCPLAMTDGAARVLEVCGDTAARERARPRLLSRDPKKFWTSGQWMTERAGGSDVTGGTDTAADAVSGDPFWTHRLSGVKWFSSATDCDMTLALGREAGPGGERSDALSLFYIELREQDAGTLKGIEILQLKDKHGTRQLPTAELRLTNTPGRLLSPSGRGVSAMSDMLNVTRTWNAVSSMGSIRRCVALANEFANKRYAFGRTLTEHPLHVGTLAGMEVEARACLQLVLEVAHLLGKVECQSATEEEAALLRILTPVVKLYTGKHAVAIASEAMEAVGGQGYCMDSGMPVLLRDAQVLPIWEGTTNVLSLDVLRALERSRGGVLRAFTASVESSLSGAEVIPELAEPVQRLRQGLAALPAAATAAAANGAGARELAFLMAHCACGGYLVKHALWSRQDSDAATAKRYCYLKLRAPEQPLPDADAQSIFASQRTPAADPARYRPYGPASRSRL